MLKICLVFLESEPQYAYKRYACKKKCSSDIPRGVLHGRSAKN